MDTISFFLLFFFFFFFLHLFVRFFFRFLYFLFRSLSFLFLGSFVFSSSSSIIPPSLSLPLLSHFSPRLDCSLCPLFSSHIRLSSLALLLLALVLSLAPFFPPFVSSLYVCLSLVHSFFKPLLLSGSSISRIPFPSFLSFPRRVSPYASFHRVSLSFPSLAPSCESNYIKNNSCTQIKAVGEVFVLFLKPSLFSSCCFIVFYC